MIVLERVHFCCCFVVILVVQFVQQQKTTAVKGSGQTLSTGKSQVPPLLRAQSTQLHPKKQKHNENNSNENKQQQQQQNSGHS